MGSTDPQHDARGSRRLATAALAVAVGLLAVVSALAPSPAAHGDDLPPPRRRSPGAPQQPPQQPPQPPPQPPPPAPPPPAPSPRPQPQPVPSPVPSPAPEPAPIPAPPPSIDPVPIPPSAVPNPPPYVPPSSAPPPGPPAPPPSLPAQPALPGLDRPTIVRIEFAGNAAYAAQSVKLKMRLKEGRPFDPSLLDIDTETLYQLFTEVTIEQQRVPGGIVLRFTVSENPVVREVVIHGLEGLKREDIDALPIRTRVGFPLVERNIDLDREDIAALYRRRGYALAAVGHPVLVETLEGGGRRVVFTVVEGPQVKVDEILIEGNASIPRKTLLDAMLTKTSKFLSPQHFNEETLREDLVELRRVYRGEGFLDAEVALVDLRWADDKSKVVVVIAIAEGERYTVGEVRFRLVDERNEPMPRPTTGPGAMPPEDRAWFTDERLRSLLGLAPGQTYSGKVEEKGRERIKEEYFSRSYIEAVVNRTELQPRATGRVVDVVVPIHEGRKYRVARVQIVGNEFTRDKIIRREVGAAPGDYVDRNALDRGLVRIRNTRFFERVSRRFDDVLGPDGNPLPDVKDVVFEVVEGKTGKLSIGGAVSGEGGLSANIDFNKRNFDIARPPRSFDDLSSGRAFTGAGQTFHVYLQPGTVVSAFGVDFGEPRLFGSDVSMRAGLSKRIGYRESYQEDIQGYYLRLGYPLYASGDDRTLLEASVTWRHEIRAIGDIRGSAVPGVFLFRGERELRSLGAAVGLRRVDDPLRPSSKSSTTLSFEHVGGFLGGGLDYWRADLNHDQRWRVHEDDAGRASWLTLGVTGGISHAFGDTPEVPPYSRYYAGGRGTIRGFEYRRVGEHSNQRPMGGEFLLVGSLEYERPLLEDILSGVAFVDGGTIGTPTVDDDLVMRLAVGLGVRVRVPGFFESTPIAIDFAFPLMEGDEDEKRVVSFSLSRDF